MKQYLVFLSIAIALCACHEKKEQETHEKFSLSDSMQHMIRIDTVNYCNVDDEISLSGEVNFNDNNVVKIFPRSSGQVIATKVSMGDKVSKGQVLAIIRSADIAGSYSDLNSADADVAIAKRQMETAESLYKGGISSEREYTEAKQNYQKAQAEHNKVISQININGGAHTTAGGEYMLTSPIDGYVVEKKVNAGDFIRPDNAENLFTVSDLQDVWIYANVYESDIPKVKEGYEVKVIPMAYPDKELVGRIDKVSQVLDPQSKVMRVRVTLNNKDMLLKPDMFAKVIVDNVAGNKAVCIPTESIISQDGKDYVVTYNNNSDMSIAEINILKTVGDKTYVRTDIRPGQKLIAQNQLLIFNQLLNE